MARPPSLLAAALVALPACFASTHAPQRGMAASNERPAAANPALVGAVRVGEVSGGGKRGLLHPYDLEAGDLERALTQSLGAARLLAPSPAEARYAVTAELVLVDQPFMVQDERVTTTIRYLLTDLRTQAPLFARNVEVPYQVRGDEAFRTGDRSRIAGEGSVRESIDTLLDALAELKVPAEPAPGAGDAVETTPGADEAAPAE